MRTLAKYVVEGSASKDLGLSFEEIISDYGSVSKYDSENEWKKAMSSKYNASSKRQADIEDAMNTQLRFERFNRANTGKEFNDDDIRYFYKFNDFPERYDKVKTLLSNEPMKFVEFLKDFLYKKLEEKKLVKKIGLQNMRDWNYSMTYSDKYLINRYCNVEQFLKDNDSKEIESKKEKENLINGIIAKLVEQTVEFKEDFLKRAEEYAKDIYKNAPSAAKKAKERCDVLEKKIEEFEKKWREEHTSYDRWHPSGWDYKDMKTERDAQHKIYSTKTALLAKYKTEKEFVDATLKEAEERFNENISVLANKINDKGINIGQLTVKHINDDPKYFTLFVTDGDKNLYARSIYAAQYSDKMIPHIRFIITERK